MKSPEKQPLTWRQMLRRMAWRGVRVIMVAYVTVMVLAMWYENSLIYFPSKYPVGDWEPAGLEFEDAWFAAADGTRLHGWYVPCEKPSAVVLFCHGNGGNLTHRIDLMQAMQNYVGATILAFDYRGYGRSEGSPHEAGVLADARAARAWLAKRAGIAERDIVMMGESLGGAVAVDLAARDGARALILEDAFTSLRDMAAYHYPWLPSRWVMRSNLDSFTQIRNYHGPLLQCHGDADRIVPYQYGQKLFDAANGPKKFITHAGADHNDPRPMEFYQELKQFLEGLPKTRA